MRRLPLAVHAVLHDADGRNGLRYVDTHRVAHLCVIGALYGTNNRRYKSRGISRSRDIYLQVARRFGLTRPQVQALITVNDCIPWTPVRRVALILLLVGIACTTNQPTMKKKRITTRMKKKKATAADHTGRMESEST